MKKIFTILTLTLVGLTAKAQIPNAGFELKDSSVYKVTVKDWSFLGYTNATENMSDNGIFVGGDGFDAPLFISDLNTTDYAKAKGFALNARPDSLVVYLSYELDANDTLLIQTKNRESQTPFGEGMIKLTGTTSGNISKVNIKINYQDPGLADSGVIMISVISADPSNTNSYFEIYSMKFVNISGNEVGDIPNKNLDKWNEVVIPNPKDWVSTNQIIFDFLGESSPNNSELVADAHSGARALKLETIDIFGDLLVGGALSIDYEIFDVNTDIDNPAPSFTVSKNHNALEGFYKFTKVGTDSGIIKVDMFKSGAKVGTGTGYFTSNTSTYTAFSVPITYTNSTSIPDSCMIQMYSGLEDADNNAGTTLWIDDLSLTGGTNSIQNLNNNLLAVIPNPSKGLITISANNEEIVYASIYALEGKLITTQVVNNQTATLDLSNLNLNGNYIIRVNTASGVYNKQISILK